MSMEVDATGAAGGATATATTTATTTDDPRLVIDTIALTASTAPSESSRLSACSELRYRCASSSSSSLDASLRMLDRITSNLSWWDREGERSEDVRLERCRVLSAALEQARKALGSAPPLPAAPPPLPSFPPDLSQRVARCLALSLSDGFHEVALEACEGARLLSEAVLVAEANSLPARERALALDSVASSSFASSSSTPLLAADLLAEAMARAAASHRRSAVREAGARALGSLSPVASRSGGALEEGGSRRSRRSLPRTLSRGSGPRPSLPPGLLWGLTGRRIGLPGGRFPCWRWR